MTTATQNPFEGMEPVAKTPEAPVLPPTDKQVSFCDDLIAECLTYPDGDMPTRALQDAYYDDALMSRYKMSELIDYLISLRDGMRRERDAETSTHERSLEGMHIRNGDVYKVQIAHYGSGRPYAKKLHVTEANGTKMTSWEYVGRRPLRFLSEDTRLTIEKAREFGKMYGVCCVCGRILTNEESIEAGIGPVCGGRL